jgi:hypothetical protein
VLYRFQKVINALEDKVGGIAADVGQAAETAFVSEASARKFIFGFAIEHEQFQAAGLMLYDYLVFTTLGLALPIQRVSVKPILVLGLVSRFLLGDEQPDRLVARRLEDPCIKRLIGDLKEFL